MLFWVTVSALRHESLSANTVLRDNNTRKEIHQGYQKPSKQRFQIHLSMHILHGAYGRALLHCEGCYYYILLLLSTYIFVKRSPFVHLALFVFTTQSA